MRKLSQAVVGIALTCLCIGMFAHGVAANASDGSCSKPAEHAATTAVDVPDYASEADRADLADTSAEEAQWLQMRSSTVDALAASDDPRDWAVAALIEPFSSDKAIKDRNKALASLAADAAPDDVLVQWLALATLHASNAAADSVPVQNLQALEPDNAAVWLDSLNAAFKSKDATGVDVALEHMAASNRFDLHYAAIARTVAQVYLRYPLAGYIRAQAQNQDWTESDEDIALIMGSALASAYALPSFQDLTLACSIDPATGKNAWRADACAQVGRLLATHGSTLISSRIGFSILRLSHTYTERDVQAARDLDWVWTGLATLSPNDPKQASKVGIARMRDWIATGNEVESIRRGMVRAGYPVTAPTDWVDKSSPFSAKRLEDDQRYANYRAEQ